MKVCIGSKAIHKENCGNAFLRYCLFHRYMIVHFFSWMLYAALYKLHICDKRKFLTKKWSIVCRHPDIDKWICEYAKRYKTHLYPWFSRDAHKGAVLIDDAPCFLLQAIFHEEFSEIYGLSIGKDGEIASLWEIEEIWKEEWNDAEVYISEKKRKKYPGGTLCYVICGRVCCDRKSYRKQMLYRLIKDEAIIFLLSFLLLIMTLCFGSAYIRWNIIFSILSDFTLILLNMIPIVCILTVLYCFWGSVSASFLSGGILVFVFSMINYFKLLYRDEPFVFSDILLIQEAGNMMGKYTIAFHFGQWMTLFVIGLITWGIHHFYLQAKQRTTVRLTFAASTVLIFICLFQSVYQDKGLYDRLGDVGLINRFSETQNYQVRGFLYPFLYSYTYAVEREPENYDPVAASMLLHTYSYQDMEEHKKANVIGIMLEAYNDFSRYVELSEDPYRNFHAIQEESLSGYFISNIFAGNTVLTERSFLNGYQNHPRYLSPSNSFVRYFKEQGYYAEALHPSYGWFYNRRNINAYLGFDNFYYIENHFQKIVYDHDLFREIITGYENNRQRGQPYFNFTVTYQNHGPYSTEASDTVYVKRNETIEEEPYQIMNNYLSGIAKTDLAMKELFDYFREEEEPVIIILFGDHNPWLGDGNSGYLQNGLRLDLGTVQGFREYYEIPYIIWANDAAKRMYGKSFQGEGACFSPMYILPYLFQYVGMEGNEYMQYLQDLYAVMPVLNKQYYHINGEWKKELDEEEQKIYDTFINTEYYYSHNLWEH